ncbi:MAG TPA: hypothetical protein ACFYD6_03105 [Candidatus Brocadiia bacterium]|nr:hypothetical protein [Candidatus Brocadiales bacterium]
MVNAKIVAMIVAIMLAVASTGYAAEHPKEHPKEHPEKKEGGLTKEELAKAIKEYVKKDTTLKGGFFTVYDQEAKKALALTLVKVHEDKLAMVKKGVYFACADFETPDGHLYDLDIFMQETKAGLEVTEITVHKEDGNARYGWVEEKGVWKRK